MTEQLTWETDTNQVVESLKAIDLPEGTKAEVIGVWVTFAEKPGTEIRKVLRDAGFHWNSKREVHGRIHVAYVRFIAKDSTPGSPTDQRRLYNEG